MIFAVHVGPTPTDGSAQAIGGPLSISALPAEQDSGAAIDAAKPHSVVFRLSKADHALAGGCRHYRRKRLSRLRVENWLIGYGGLMLGPHCHERLMRKVAVFGNAAGGKSTLAQRLPN
jgi:hypothetical protein